MNIERVSVVVTTIILALHLVGCQPETDGSAEAPAGSADITASAGVIEVTTAEDGPDDFAFVAPVGCQKRAEGWAMPTRERCRPTFGTIRGRVEGDSREA